MKIMRGIGKAIGELAAGYRSAAGRTAQSYDPRWFDRGADVPGIMSDEHKVTQPYKQNGTLHRGVRVLSDILASIPFQLVPEGSNDALPDTDALMQTFIYPNENTSGRELWARTSMDLYLFGNAVWMHDGLARLSSGGPEEFPRYLVSLPMPRVTPWYDMGTGRHMGYTLRTRGSSKNLTHGETVHIKMDNPYDTVWGMSEIEAIAGDLDSAHMAALTNIRLLKRGGPGTVIEQSMEGSGLIGPEAETRMKKDLDENFADEDEHSTLVLHPGMKVARVGATQRDMDFDKLSRLNRENIAGTLGSVPALQGILEYANYANMGSQLEYVFLFTVFPMALRIESAVQTQLLKRFGQRYTAKFDRTSCRALYQNLESLSRTAKAFYDMRVPFEAINSKLELGFDLDEYPWLKEDPGPGGMGPIEDPVIPAPQQGQSAEVQREVTRSGKWLRLITIADGAERRMLGSWRKQVDWLRDETMRRVKAYTPQSGRTAQSAAGDLVPPDSEAGAHAWTVSEPGARQAATSGRRSVIAEIQPKAGISQWDLLDPTVTKIIKARKVEIVGASSKMAGRMRDTLAEGIKKGETVTDLAARVLAKHREEYIGQAKVVARTETMASFSEAREETKREAGITTHEWLTARDDKVRENHMIDGEQTTIGEPFSNGLLYPLEPGAGPEDACNCRCIAAAVVN